MGNPLVLFDSGLIFIVLKTDLTENLRVFLVAMLISHMAFEAGWVDELQTEAALSLFHILWNDRVIVWLIGISLILTVFLKPTEICHVALSRAPLDSSHFWKASDSGNIERVPSLCALLWCVLTGSFLSWFYYSKDMELHLTSLKNLI